MKMVASLCGAVAAFLGCASTVPQKTPRLERVISLSEDSCGKSVEVQRGNTIALALGSSGPGGYVWHMDWNPRKRLASVANKNHAADASAKPVGAAAQEAFSFRAVEKGAVTLEARLRRSWEDRIHRSCRIAIIVVP
jgi:predicted secreted protein